MFSRLFLVLLGAFAIACSDSSAPPASSCPGPRPAFTLTVTTESGAPLSIHTVITVKYGSGEEVYDASNPPASPQAVFCQSRASSDAGDASDAGEDGATGTNGTIVAIECTLWTDGAADVTVESDGYPKIEQTFEAKSDACGLTTIAEVVDLDRSRPDGGS